MRHRCSLFFFLTFLFFFIGTANTRAETVSASHTPWSGYWWPMRNGGLLTGLGYRGFPAPLDKYASLDPVNASLVKATYSSKYYKTDAPSWWGMCWEWALAASVEPEPARASVIKGVPWRVGDKKGLVTLAHSDDVVVFGQGNDPVVFHSWLLEKIKGQGRVFVADLDVGEEIWSYPIFKYTMTENIVGLVKSVSVVTYYADDNVTPDFEGTAERFTIFTYDLYLDQSGNVIGGAWTGSSIESHPNTLTYHVAKRSTAPALNQDLVNFISQSVDDEYENTAAIWPGSYQLTLQDVDNFELAIPSAAENATLTVTKDSRSQPVIATLYTSDGHDEQLVFNSSGSVFRTLSGDTIRTLVLSSPQISQSGLYTLRLDSFSPTAVTVPYLTSNDAWLGVALRGATTGLGGTLIGRSLDGLPTQTYIPGQTFAHGLKTAHLLDTKGWNNGLMPTTAGLEYYPGAANATAVILTGGQNGMLASNGQSVGAATVISPGVIPPTLGYSQYTLALRNRSQASNPVRIRSYSTSGQLNDETNLTLNGQETRLLSLGNSPFIHTTMHSWFLVEGKGPVDLFTMARSSSKPNLGENVYATPADSSLFYVPHYPSGNGWNTLLHMINPSAAPTTVTLSSLATKTPLASYTVQPRSRLEINCAAIPALASMTSDMIQIQCSSPMTGYMSYVTTGDTATMPLLRPSSARSSFSLPHFAGVAPWWTGVALGNPSKSTQTITLLPFDTAGAPMIQAQKSLTLQPGRTTVDLMERLVGVDPNQLSSVSIMSSDPAGIIGFYLYGTTSNSMLAGNLFQ